jgi:hypothetical protein
VFGLPGPEVAAVRAKSDEPPVLGPGPALILEPLPKQEFPPKQSEPSLNKQSEPSLNKQSESLPNKPRLVPEATGGVPGTIITHSPVDGVVAGTGCGDDCCETMWSRFRRLFCCGGWDCYNPNPYNKLWFGAEAAAWVIRKDTAPPLVVLGNVNSGFPRPGTLADPATQILFGNGQYGEEPNYGFRLYGGYWFGEMQRFGIEASGFYLFENNTQFQAAGNGTGTAIIARPYTDVNPAMPGTPRASGLAQSLPFRPDIFGSMQPSALAGGDSVATYSRMFGADVNFRTNWWRNCCFRLDFLAGFRYFGLDDGIKINDLEVPVAPFSTTARTFTSSFNTDSFQTTNRFYGGQVGADWEMRWRRWSLDTNLKLGVGAMQESVDIRGATLINVGGTLVNFPMQGVLAQPTNIGHHDQTKFAFVPELGLKLGYQVTDHVRLTVGYNVLWASSVVRPGAHIDTTVNSGQLPSFMFTNPPTALPPSLNGGPARPSFAFHDSDFWAQGITLGIEFTY